MKRTLRNNKRYHNKSKCFLIIREGQKPMAKPKKFTKKYWEREKAKVVPLGKNVFKLFPENGKVQVYPKVETAPNGVGRGSTIDIEGMSSTEHEQFIQIMQYAITEFGKYKSQQKSP
jgi:hypothetical protein